MLDRRTFAQILLAQGALLTLYGCSSGTAGQKRHVTKWYDRAAQEAKSIANQAGTGSPSSFSSSSSSSKGVTHHHRSFDMHCDTIDKLGMHAYSPYQNATESGTFADTDCKVSVSRMGDVGWVQCYAVWLPDDSPSASHLEFYRAGVRFFKEQMSVCSAQISQITNARDIENVLSAGKVCALLTVENSACVEEGVGVIEEFAADGVKMAGLSWNGQNALASGYKTNAGISQLGWDAIESMERHKIVVDVSHLNDTGFWEFVSRSKRPFAASHSNSRAICGSPRNLTDEQFRAIQDRGGVVGLNFERSFISDGDTSFDALIAHVEHWLDLGGENVIALGSDYDGSSPPGWLDDCSDNTDFYNQTVARLGQTIADKLFFSNALNFFVRNETV